MQPKFIYQYKVTFSNPNDKQHQPHVHFYLDFDEVVNAIKSQSDGQIAAVEKLKPGTEFCTDFEIENENDYICIRPFVQATPVNYMMHFFVRINNDIRWFVACYDLVVIDKYKAVVSIASIHPDTGAIVNINLMTHVPDTLKYSPEQILQAYVINFSEMMANPNSIVSTYFMVNDDK